MKGLWGVAALLLGLMLMFGSCSFLESLEGGGAPADGSTDSSSDSNDSSDDDTSDDDAANEDPWAQVSITDGVVGKYEDAGTVTATTSVGALSAQIHSAGSDPYDPKVHVELPTLTADRLYRLTFSARADVPRPVHVKVGTQTSSDPWWGPLHDGSARSSTTLFSANRTYEIDFASTNNDPGVDTSVIDLSAIDLVFELGTVAGNSTLTTVHVSDIQIFDLGPDPDAGPDSGPTAAYSYPAANASNDSYDPGTGWTLDWSDEFNDGEFDTNVWTKQRLMDPYNGEWQQYTGDASTAYEQDGYMILEADWSGVVHADNNYTSARVISNPGGQSGATDAEGRVFRYGKIAARIQLPYGKGIWPAFWMLGDNISETGGDTAWPMSGEIDILETGAGGDPDYGQGTVHGTIHHDPTADNSSGDNLYLTAGSYTLPDGEFFGANFRVFEIEWDEQQIIWRLDGQQFGSMSISEAGRTEFHEDFYVLFNIAVGGNFTADPDDSTDFPQYMYIDWIRHYVQQ